MKLFAFCLALQAGSVAWSAERLIVISIDGLSYDLFKQARADKKIPALAQIAGQGFSGKLLSVFPSTTWPAHTSMVTGVYPNRHGIYGNHWWPRTDKVNGSRKIKIPTLFSVAAGNNYRVAAFRWPYSYGFDSIDYSIPGVMRQAYIEARHTSEKLLPHIKYLFPAFFSGPIQTRRGLIKLYKRVSKKPTIYGDIFINDLALYMLKKPGGPRALFIHFTSLDQLQHYMGLNRRYTYHALQQVDELVKKIMQAAPRSRLLVVSDHGAVRIKRSLDLRYHRGEIKQHARFISNGQVSFVYRKKPGSTVNLAGMLSSLQQKFDQCIERVMTRQQFFQQNVPYVPDDEAAPDYALLSKPDCRFSYHPFERAMRTNMVNSAHGYLPGHKGLQGVWLGRGPGIAQSNEPVHGRIVDIMPTVLALTGWQKPANTRFDGRVIRQVLAE